MFRTSGYEVKHCKVGNADLRISWFCSLVCSHWQELMEWNSGCGVSDHVIITLIQLQMATKLGFQALNLAFSTFLPLDFVTQILFQKYHFWYVTDSLDCIHDIHCYPLSGVFESQYFCRDFSVEELTLLSSRESFIMVREGRTKSSCD